MDGDLALVGTPGHFTVGSGPGPVVVFAYREGGWVEHAKLEPPPGAEAGRFGHSLALDGRLALVGAPEADENGPESGACYLFERFASGWRWTHTLRSGGLGIGDDLGDAVCFARPGAEELVLGAPGDDHAAGVQAGRATVLERAPVFEALCEGAEAGDCPCANAGDPGHGCANGSFASGAELVGSGSTSVALDEARLHARSATPGAFGAFLLGEEALERGAHFGDGRLCLAGALRAYPPQEADAGGASASPPGLAESSGATPGDSAGYQWWYRDPTLGPCGARFNLSNALRVRWIP